jgi:hypothetical protein
MARTPNYNFERSERERLKKLKKAERAESKAKPVAEDNAKTDTAKAPDKE